MELPLWINEDLFQLALNRYFNEKRLKILEFSYKPAIAAGENFATYVYRINVTFLRNEDAGDHTREKFSFVLKCVREGLMEAIVEDMNSFRKEVDMFANILPKMNDICGGSKSIFSAKCIHTSLTPHKCLILEDLSPLGFKVQDRRIGLDMEHVLKVLERLANFHASSVVLIKKSPSILNDMYCEGIYPSKGTMTNWIKISFEMLTELTAGCKEFEMYHEKFKRMPDHVIIERAMNSWHREADQFSVLNHGDLWVNNIMFSYEENGSVKDCKFVDFQLCIYGSPAIDLHYFLSTSLTDNVINEIDFLLDYYYAHFIMTFVKLRYNLRNIPSLKEFKIDYKRRSFYGLLTMATTSALVKAESREDANFENFMTNSGKNSFRHHCYNNDVYKSMISHFLPIYDKYGIFL